VISVSQFCKMHSSFWKGLTPSTDIFVRRLNLGHYERDFPEMTISAAPMRRGFINEIAFAVFCQDVRNNVGWPPPELARAEVEAAVAEVRSRPLRREGREMAPDAELSAGELLDIGEQRSRLLRMFTFDRPGGALVTGPSFPGCGIIDACEGDLIVSNILYEVKAGDRFFRSIDIRQLIMYGTLNFISKRFTIERLGLFNPRVGVSATMPIDDLCFEISGKQSGELFSEIASAISSGEISR
jgi:hypothetical protein